MGVQPDADRCGDAQVRALGTTADVGGVDEVNARFLRLAKDADRFLFERASPRFMVPRQRRETDRPLMLIILYRIGMLYVHRRAVGTSAHAVHAARGRRSSQISSMDCAITRGGARLGNPRNIAHAGALGRGVQTATADQFVSGLMPRVQVIRSTGAITLEAMTQALNQRGIRSARGGQWRASSVANLLARAEKAPSLRFS